MVFIFKEKLAKGQYISQYLYNQVLHDEPSSIPNNFNLDNYNNLILERLYEQYYPYFQTMYKDIDNNIHLDKEQCKAILADEEYALILAGAGTGKTTTMASKVKYLVDILHVNPKKILVMSYTKKATEELEKRIVLDFEIPANVTTFHSLGLAYIRQIFNNHKCYVVDENKRNQIFLQYFQEKIYPYKEKVLEIDNLFSNFVKKEHVFSKHFLENFENYNTYHEYFQKLKQDKINECQNIAERNTEIIDRNLNYDIPITIKGEIVKSKGEAIIANFLYCNKIEYQYEKIYRELVDDYRVYRPDFTIYSGGLEIYVEYFGLSNYKNNELKTYEKIKKQKEQYHELHHNLFIKIDYQPNENIINILKTQLQKLGVKLQPRTDEEIFEQLLDNNPISQIFSYANFLYNSIDTIKTSIERNNFEEVVKKYIVNLTKEEQDIVRKQFTYINEFYHYYQQQLFNNKETTDYGFDYSDMIYYASLYLDHVINKENFQYEYIIIDEYQDISKERYELTKKIVANNHAKVIVVGDDWQSIYSFAGSKIEYIYNFPKYFPGAKTFYITTTYRNSKNLINYAGQFIMKNKDQIQKELISPKVIDDPIKFIYFEELEEYLTLKKLLLKIHHENPSHNILILGRTNRIIKSIYEDEELLDDVGTKITFTQAKDIDIDGMTIHKSKGLSADEVILIGLDPNFPNHSHLDNWVEVLFKNQLETEAIEDAEERRLFYVALTRTKNHVYLLVNKNPKYRSPFLNELARLVKNNQIT